MQHKVLARTALLLAITLVFQSLRLFIPLPPFFTTFIIGSLVNACLLVALETIGFTAALLIGVMAPGIAYLQQLLILPIFIIPVAMANCLYVSCYKVGSNWGPMPGVVIAALAKSLFLWGAFAWLLTLIAINPLLAAGLMFVMSWPQWITSFLGGLLAIFVIRRLQRSGLGK